MSQKSSRLLLLCTFFAGIITLLPQIDVQPLLSQGDHGRDLYAFSQSAKGAFPYKDYWWVYGPFMPFYYAGFMTLLGESVASVIAGKTVFILISGLFFYRILALCVSPLWAFLGACWFFIFHNEFFFTFNHAGGIAFILANTFYILRYALDRNHKDFHASLIYVFFLSLVKLNFGLIALALNFITLGLSRLILNKKIKHHTKLASLFCLSSIAFVYFILIFDLPAYYIRQCFPFLMTDHPFNESPFKALGSLFNHTTADVMHSNILTVFSVFILMVASRLILPPKSQNSERVGLVLSTLILFYFGCLHEFLFSGRIYRIFWAEPFAFLILFIVIARGANKFSRPLQWISYALVLSLLLIQGIMQADTINRKKTGTAYFAHQKAKVYMFNSNEWKQTVLSATNSIQENIKPDESFFALPYDPLYYYLTDKTSPTKELIFFDHINITQQQEENIIKRLEDKNIRWVLLSSRMISLEHGLGVFGKTYCPILAAYINEHFQTVKRLGEWNKSPGWAWNHGVVILKRID